MIVYIIEFPGIITPGKQEFFIQFSSLSLDSRLLQAVAAEGYTIPTPIQEQAIPPVLQGRDLLGIAQTGTGKTAAFALPVLHRLNLGGRGCSPHSPRCLALTPTRELALQVQESFEKYGANLPLRSTCVFGGVGDFAQKKALKHGADILVATPGRLLDLMNQGAVHLRQLEIFILDEADRMLDMGFIHDVRKVVSKLPPQRQTLFFSATMPQEISSLASSLLRDPVYVEVAPVSTPIERIEQSLYYVEKTEKLILLKYLLKDAQRNRVLVFTRTKHGANKVCQRLERFGINCAAIHGNKSQGKRQEALAGFKDGSLRVLVATDIAARGIDVDGVSDVINFDLPHEPETFVHRIGRTARAGSSGRAIAFCASDEKSDLHQIERLIRFRLPVLPLPQEFSSLVSEGDAGSEPASSREERPENRGYQKRRRPQNGATVPVAKPTKSRQRTPSNAVPRSGDRDRSSRHVENVGAEAARPARRQRSDSRKKKPQGFAQSPPSLREKLSTGFKKFMGRE
jgi:ATP-dependent RNA helicase RhlE